MLATGGLGQIYSSTTNPPVATGDGMALALRAGAVVADLEFVQFHPTVLWLGEGSTGQQPLISEAVRGEGAFLVDADGRRFMQGSHELADLAPRDVVARAIVEPDGALRHRPRLPRLPAPGREFLEARFPSIVASCRQLGFDPATELLPVAPAQHYASGGVRTDLRGRSSLPGLYACGEVSCTGVHGANRLASNSLLEGLVFAHRIADDISARFAAGELPLASRRPSPTAPTRSWCVGAPARHPARDDGRVGGRPLGRVDGMPPRRRSPRSPATAGRRGGRSEVLGDHEPAAPGPGCSPRSPTSARRPGAATSAATSQAATTCTSSVTRTRCAVPTVGSRPPSSRPKRTTCR